LFFKNNSIYNKDDIVNTSLHKYQYKIVSAKNRIATDFHVESDSIDLLSICEPR
jgi:hypothetical protein